MDATLFVRVGAHVPEVKVGGVAEMLPMGDAMVRLPHAGTSAETGTDPTSLTHAPSEKSLTSVEHESPVGVPQVQVHRLSSS